MNTTYETTDAMQEPAYDGPLVRVHDLVKEYDLGGEQVYALDGVSMDVYPGEFVAIMGASGSGKSTLFHIVGGMTPPTSGEVIVGGRNLSAVGDSGRTELRRTTVGFVFQKFNLLPNLTARDNIRTALHISGQATDVFEKDFLDILALLGIAGRLDHKPSEMSGGEQQRVAIARALATHPAILLADEPTGNLDTANSLAVLKLLRDLNERLGQTILMITHNNEAAQYADRIVHMRDGVIVETSTPAGRQALGPVV